MTWDTNVPYHGSMYTVPRKREYIYAGLALALAVMWANNMSFADALHQEAAEKEAKVYRKIAQDRATANPSGIGHSVNDRRRLSDSQRLDILIAQLADPYRNPDYDAELQEEIVRTMRQVARQHIYQQASR